MLKRKRTARQNAANLEAPAPFEPLTELHPLFAEMQVYSAYIPMRDGVRLAADVYLPAPLLPGARLPAILEQTRYWRSSQLRPPLSWFMPKEGEAFPLLRRQRHFFTSQGYVVVVVDVRGSVASFGVWRYPWEAVAVQDSFDIVEWITRQPWSDGQVAGIGNSFPGNTAELLLATEHPAVKAVIPQFNHPDPFTDVGFPGGILNERFVRAWGEMDINLDLNRSPSIFGGAMNIFIQGVRPVGGSSGRIELAEAVRMHRENGKLHGLPGGLIFRDQVHPLAGYAPDDAAPIRFAETIRRAQVPVFGWASWMDAGTAQAALRRFLSYTGPQRAVIGAWSHGGFRMASPYLPEDAPMSPPSGVKRREILRFLNPWLKPGAEGTKENTLIYYTCGAEIWRQTHQWPPAGVEWRNLYFAPERRLQPSPPETAGEDIFAVDFRASSGPYNRWWELGVAKGRSVEYSDRRAQSEHVLAYETGPLERDMEISGSPVLTLYVDSSEPDCAFFAYLEDVLPDGRILCIGEGELRAIHRRSLTAPLPYYQDLPYHSFRQADALPLQPGQVGEVSFALLPLSVLVRKDHRLRIAIAGHDNGNFERVPARGNPVWRVLRSRLYPSHLRLPVIPS
jgi:putative CocE/NonD family hydrolase